MYHNLFIDPPAGVGRQVHAYRHFATTASGLHTDEVTVCVPYGDNRLGCYVFTKNGASGLVSTYLWRLYDGVPAVNTGIGSATRVGTWTGAVTDAQAWASTYYHSSTAGDTATFSVTGSRGGLRLVRASNAG